MRPESSPEGERGSGTRNRTGLSRVQSPIGSQICRINWYTVPVLPRLHRDEGPAS
jgi:hypothetical protein